MYEHELRVRAAAEPAVRRILASVAADLLPDQYQDAYRLIERCVRRAIEAFSAHDAREHWRWLKPGRN